MAEERGEVRIQKPGLFWRRIAAWFIDVLVLISIRIVFELAGSGPIVSCLLTWIIFLSVWFGLQLKYGASPGKLLVQIRATRTATRGESSPALFARLAVTWLAYLIFLDVANIDAAVKQTDAVRMFATLGLGLLAAWYVAILISLIATKGKRGLHDMLTGFRVHLKTPTFLPAWRKAVAVSAMGVLVGWIIFVVAMISMTEPSLPPNQAPTAPSAYERNAHYEPADIRSIYEGRVFEVQTTWNEPGGFLWMESVLQGQSGTALMFVNDATHAYLVTNWHVVAPSQAVSGGYHCRLRRSPSDPFVDGDVVAGGKNLDLALIRVQLVGEWQPAVVPVAGIAELQQGERAVALGNALAQGISVTDGLISMVEGDSVGQVIRTSTPVSPGNSGGPLFLERGALFAGIVTAQNPEDRAQNMNYAIPAEYIVNHDNWIFTDEGASSRFQSMLRGEAAGGK